jgi:hypothetical protein
MSQMLITAAELVVLLAMLGGLVVKRQRAEQRSVRPLRVRS